MRSASSIKTKFCLSVFLGLSFLYSTAQENSPFTRYGLGDYFTGSHIISRAMGGLSAVYADGVNNNVGQAVNFNNPATYGSFYLTSFDIGLTIDTRTLRSNSPSGRFSSKYFIPAYLALGVPLKKSKNLGLAFGLKPVSRINYAVNSREKVAGDSLFTLYEGTGGLNQVFIGVGKKWKKLSIGLNTGYNFGRRELSTKRSFLSDTVFYYQSNSSTTTNFGGAFLNPGFQYEIPLNKKTNTETKTTESYFLRLGATATLSQKLSATQDVDRKTFTQSVSGDIRIDSVFSQREVKGDIQLPATYTGGATYHKTLTTSRGVFEMWSIGAEYTTTKWTKYRFYGQPDPLVNSWQFRVGAQFSLDPSAGRNYWNSVNYRAGVHIGKDYVNADGKGLRQFGVSLGAGLPIRKWRSYDNQFTVINTALQFGKRGSGVNNITENYFQFSFGLSLSDLWFEKRKFY